MHRPAISLAFSLAALGCRTSHPNEETGLDDPALEDTGTGYHLGTVCLEHTETFAPTDTSDSFLPEETGCGTTPSESGCCDCEDTSSPSAHTGPWSMPETGVDWVDTDCFGPGSYLFETGETGTWEDLTCCDEWWWKCEELEDHLGIEHTGFNACDWICNG